MRYIKKLECETGLDISGSISLFFVFLVCFFFLSKGAQQFPYGFQVFGLNINQHVGNLMSEHEAGKSISLLSFLAIILGVIKSLKGSSFHKGFVDSKIIIPITNFTLCLTATMLAITYAVAFTLSPLPGTESVYFIFLYHGFLKHTILCFSIGFALISLNKVTDNLKDKVVNITISLFWSSLFFGIYFKGMP
ncbi:hypothetical protein O1B79_003558 [Vibrio cholerae]|nr:hypothetical protein [Vibrio cholerae]